MVIAQMAVGGGLDAATQEDVLEWFLEFAGDAFYRYLPGFECVFVQACLGR